MKATFVVTMLVAVVVIAALIVWPEWFGPLEMAVLVLFSVGLAAFVAGLADYGDGRLSKR